MSRPPRQIPARARLAALIALGAAAALGAPPVHAQTAEELTRARQVFTEGKQLEGKAQWADALEKFKEVGKVKMTPQVRYHVAFCEENLGRLVSAIKGFDLAYEEAKIAGSVAAEVEKLAPERAAALRARVAKLHIDVTGTIIDSKVTVDDVAVSAKELGTDMMVDPGPHVVEVKDRDGKSTFRKDLTLAEKGAQKLEVPVDDKEAPQTAPTDTSTPPPPPPSRVPVIVAGSVGVAAFVASAVFFVMRSGTINDILKTGGCMPDPSGKSDYVCKTPGVGQQIDDLQSAGHRDLILSGVFLGVGAAATVTAVGFLIAPLVRKTPIDPNAPPKASFTVVPTGKGAALVGTF